MQISIDLPFPPTLNHLWKHGRGKKKTGKAWTYKSKPYVLWISQADGILLQQKRGPIKMLRGRFDYLLELYTSDGRKRRDGDNRHKAPLDYLTRIGLIEDDSKAESGTWRWTTKENAPPYGCRITLTALDE